MSQIKRHEHFIVEYYNSLQSDLVVESINDIPKTHLRFISFLDYIDIVKPLLCTDLVNGLSRRQIAIKYKVTEAEVRGFGIRIGVYKAK